MSAPEPPHTYQRPMSIPLWQMIHDIAWRTGGSQGYAIADIALTVPGVVRRTPKEMESMGYTTPHWIVEATLSARRGEGYPARTFYGPFATEALADGFAPPITPAPDQVLQVERWELTTPKENQ